MGAPEGSKCKFVFMLLVITEIEVFFEKL